MRCLVALFSEDPRVRERVTGWLATRGFRVSDEHQADTVAVVLEFPGARGVGRERLEELAALPRRPALLALCPHGSHEAAVAALKAGADDCLCAPFDPEELEIKLERALQARGERAELEALRGESPRGPTPSGISGTSPVICAVRERIERAALGRATVLITGETGTGKELVAVTIHERSSRRRARMVKVNCAALPDPLLESELFGHERGAFTGAEQQRIGRFEEADGGTLFLDEVGDMHPRTQAKVLRALQEQEFERLGGARPIRVDVRVIAATNQDLRERIARGLFREDLLFRLEVVPIVLPPLRERAADVQELARVFLCEFNAGQPRPKRGLRPGALEALCAHAWPGNVRELRNTLERAVLMGPGEWVEVEDLGLGEALPGPSDAPLVSLPPGGVDYREVERALLVAALERAGWVQKRAAKLLRMSRRQLHYRIERLGITHAAWPKNRGSAGDSAGRGEDVC